MSEPHPPETTTAYVPRPTPQPPVWRGPGRRVLRGVWIGLAAVAGLVLLAVVVALVWLHTGGGARELGRVVTDQARQAIQGSLSLRSIEVRGFLNICSCVAMVKSAAKTNGFLARVGSASLAMRRYF